MSKLLVEKRNEKLVEMQKLVNSAKTEVRAMSEEETLAFEALTAEVARIDATIKAEEELEGLEEMKVEETKTDVAVLEKEERAFINFVKGETRALDIANNGGVIPTSVANRIVTRVKELAPILELATVYNVGGDLVLPVYDDSTPIQAGYIDDLTELTEQTGKFTTIKLQAHIIGALAKISKSLMNRTDFDVVSFVVEEIAKAIAETLEKETVVGTVDKMSGVLSSTNLLTTASATAFTADELIDLQMNVPQVYQKDAVWIMNKATFKAVRKLKDGEGNYLFNTDATTAFGYTVLGSPVHISDNAPTIAAGKEVIAYGDMSGLSVKFAQGVQIQILNEKYATQFGVGVIAYVEADSKVTDSQKIAVLKMKA